MRIHELFRRKTGDHRAEPDAGRNTGAALLPDQALRYLNRVSLVTRPLQVGEPVGSRPSQVRKPASEFLEHRQYAPGDDLRHVDWKASARQEHVFIKQGEEQKATVVYLLLDCSASMAWGSPPKLEATLRLAYALGYLALAHNDRLVIVPAGGPPGGSLHPLGPLWGKGQAPLLNRYLRAIRFQGQVDLGRALAGIRRQKRSRGGLVLVLSDLLGAGDLSGSLDALPAPEWSVVLCHLLHPREISPDLNGFFEMVDAETGQKKRYPVTPRVLEIYRKRMQTWLEDLAGVCRERKAVYTSLPTHWSFENQILPQLLQDKVVKRL
jgi:uncharacterized protein (DUF58 family)